MNQEITWRPDWKVIEAYPELVRKENGKVDKNKFDAEQWAWEFLRRSPKFQSDYEECLQAKVDGQYLDCSEMLDNYALTEFSTALDPKNNTPPKFASYFPEISYPHAAHMNRSNNTPLSPDFDDEIVFKFSMKLPFYEQSERAKQSFEDCIKKLKERDIDVGYSNRISYESLITYLRVLDAEASGVRPIKMAEVIHPDHGRTVGNNSGPDSINTKLNAARELRDGGYVTLFRTVIFEN